MPISIILWIKRKDNQYILLCRSSVYVARKVLLLKLYYLGTLRTQMYVKEFWRMKKIRSGPISLSGLRKMIQIFDILLARRRRQIQSSCVENVAATVLESSRQSLLCDASVSVVSHVLDIEFLQWIFNFYPDKIQPVYLLQYGDLEG